jgi:hypothetical protein
LTLRPAVFDRRILTFDVTAFLEALVEYFDHIGGLGWRPTAQEPDHRQRWLLRMHRERPRNGRAAEQRDELAPLHSITSSARASSVGGTSSFILKMSGQSEDRLSSTPDGHWSPERTQSEISGTL